jgi:hypothetical protein
MSLDNIPADSMTVPQEKTLLQQAEAAMHFLATYTAHDNGEESVPVRSKLDELRAIMKKMAASKASDPQTPPSAMMQQATAWLAVSKLLRELMPERFATPNSKSGLDTILALLKDLYAASMGQGVVQTTFDLQRDVMARSGQDLPEAICLTPQSVMYAALNLEELGEQIVAMADGINYGTMGPTAGSRMFEAGGWSHCASLMGHVGADIQQQARNLRGIVKDTFRGTNPRIALSLSCAKEIIDGANDVTVVNAGFLESMGVPAMACYEEVTFSNLSKANPETGVIDKEPDGKWIKGVNYKAPDLGRIIEPLLWKIPA